jgi:molybdate-binding protein/DNA-binding transcriptional regulator YhcF (GntR family)
MVNIKISDRANIPLYKQIVDQVKQMVANYQVKPGERMPTVRGLAKRLGINPATVARAYQELEQEGILGASRRRGTIVLGESDNPQRLPLRQSRLAGIVNDLLLQTLSQGYTPDELEATFTLQIARWRIQRENADEPSVTEKKEAAKKVIRIVGSNDLALDLLVSRLKYNCPDIDVQMTAAGSLGGLLAIQEGIADVAGIHLLDEETGEYNYPYIKHTLQGIKVAVVHLADRTQGFMVMKDNPRNIKSLEDLKRPDVTFVNRQKGSGTRVWLDYKLRELGIQPNNIKGYNRELDTHLAVGMAIVRGEADVGLGIQAAAYTCRLDFIPATSERFDLVIPMKAYESPQIAALLEIIRSDDFKRVVQEMGGYDTSQTGDTVMVR